MKPVDLNFVERYVALWNEPDASHTVTPKDNGLMVGAPQAFRAELSRACAEAGITLIEIGPTTESLEEAFLAMLEMDM